MLLVAREEERRRIEALLDGARKGMNGALVLVGEPGIGKTALLDHAAVGADGFQILRARGVQSEAELPFAALFELCRPILTLLEQLEPAQAQTLRAVFGLSDDQRITPFAIGAATLSLLAAAAEEQPLLLLVDDAHWLDRASADSLVFAIRRLHVDSVAALFATRPGEGRALSDHELPELELGRLDAASAAEREGVIALAQGNPLALIELPRAAAGEEGHWEPARVGKQLERAFHARVETLPEPTRKALVVAAAASTGELAVLRVALERMSLSVENLEPAEVAGLLSFEAGAFAFRHPLIRSAVYQAANPADRRRAHAALAEALAGDDRAAWHLAAAVVGPDDRAATALEHAAETAARRAGFAAAAVAHERAARVSELAEDRLRRLSAAAEFAWLAGRTRHALSLIEEGLAHADDDARRAELLHLRGTIEHFGGASDRAAATLENAAALLSDSNPHVACIALTEANGSLLAAGEVRRAVALSKRLVALADPEQPREYLLASLARGSALLMDGRPEEGLPFLQDAAKIIREHEQLSSDPRNLPWAAMAAYWLGDIDSMASCAAAASRWAREHAAIATLTFSARLLGRAQLIMGQWPAARASLEESLDAARIAGLSNQQAQSLGMLAWLDAAQGREGECERKVEEARALADRVNYVWRNDLLRALVLLELGTGLVEPSPVDRLRSRLGNPPLLRDAPSSATVPELVEALVRAGDAEAAVELLEPFADEAERVGQPSARAVALRCRGLLAAEDAYVGEFQRALELHALDDNPFATARSRLAFGERLRRSGRRIEAREHLKQAIGIFDRLGAVPWSERARSELRSTGERVSARGPTRSEELTPHELRIAILAADGKTNREIAVQLFLSPKTIEWHLGHVYRKLGIRSRSKLARVLEELHASPSPPEAEVG
jgi:DNA-binding CsgD family transcriptional regulator